MRYNINTNEYLNVTKHGGKMEGIPSISTNKYTNENCQKLMNSTNQNLICKSCFVDKVARMYKDVEIALQHNSDILTKRILTKEEIKEFSKAFINNIIVRFESFGDLNNEIQLINYNNIAKACKYTKFALWTKHFSIVREYLKKGNKLASNITLVLSSPFLDRELNKQFVDAFKKYHKRTITFTVTKDKNNPNINCGGRKCLTCRNCYDSKNPKDVIELIK